MSSPPSFFFLEKALRYDLVVGSVQETVLFCIVIILVLHGGFTSFWIQF